MAADDQAMTATTRGAPRAIIVGGSVGGLFAANLLRRSGCEPLVLERSGAELAARGAGLGMGEELPSILAGIGIAIDASSSALVRGRRILTADGRVLHDIGMPSATTSWDTVWQALRDALPDDCYRAGAAVAKVEQTPASATAILLSGERIEADLVVAADGAFSTVRSQLVTDLAPAYAGYVAWRAVVRENDVSSSLCPSVFERMSFCFPGDGFALSMPMAPLYGSPNGQRRIYCVWFKPVNLATLGCMFTDAEGRTHGLSIPPPLVRAELIEDLIRSAGDQLAPQIGSLFAHARQPILQAIFDLASPSLAFGRIALLGDAAFVARPHVGTGVTKAALDAQALAESLWAYDWDIPSGLAAYERVRRDAGRAVVERGRRLGETAMQLPALDAHAWQQQHDSRHETFVRQFGAAGRGIE